MSKVVKREMTTTESISIEWIIVDVDLDSVMESCLRFVTNPSKCLTIQQVSTIWFVPCVVAIPCWPHPN